MRDHEVEPDDPGWRPGPNHPGWRPDPTGRRLAMIKAARRGAMLAILCLAPVVAAAELILPPEQLGAPTGSWLLALLMSLPGIALLGAGLTPATLGSRWSAASAGLAMAVGVPIAAVLSAMVAVFLMVAFVRHGVEGAAAGLVLRDGVLAAVRVAPLVALASIAWVVAVRRWASSAPGPDRPSPLGGHQDRFGREDSHDSGSRG